MPETVDGIREVRRRLVAQRVRVPDVPGWETRGTGTLTPRGMVRHHTASPRTAGRYASLRVVTNGRAGLRNALCTVYQPRGPEPEVWLIAARTSWHAGRGGWSGLAGNAVVVGDEMENDGVGEPFHPHQMEAAVLAEIAFGHVFGFDASMGCEHSEWTTRKVDRHGIDGVAIRRQVAAGVPDQQEDEMRRGDRGTEVQVMQIAVIEELRAAGLYDRGTHGEADGDFGPLTDEAVTALQVFYGYGRSGVVDLSLVHRMGRERTDRFAKQSGGGERGPQGERGPKGDDGRTPTKIQVTDWA